VIFKVAGNGQFATVEGGIANAVDALIGLNLDSDEITPGAGNNNAGSANL
jgi:hypothetical protein